jgi:DNA-binding IclR family transcriptional regulator
MRNNVIIKVARLLLLLQHRRTMPAIPDLALMLECDKRTVYRYLEAFEYAGWKLPKRRFLEQA